LRLLLPPSRTRVEAPAPLDAYTGTLYKALGVSAWSASQRGWAENALLIHSAELGLVTASAFSPAPPLTELVAADEAVVDLRSPHYARRDPIPPGGWTVRVVNRDADGRRLAISHWNKHFKGAFVGALVADTPTIRTIEDLIRWSQANGHALEPVAEGQLDLIV
jgi:cytoplasmic iron level regulating protein YaaA (DUF328/UPF0246 family)